MPSFTSNITDLEKSGPIVKVQTAIPPTLAKIMKGKGEPIPDPVEVQAIIDTGATSSAVNPSVIQQLNLNPIGTTLINTPSCSGVSCNQYDAAILFPQQKVMIVTNNLIEAPLSGQNIQCLIGRDVLKHGVFVYIGYANLITFSV